MQLLGSICAHIRAPNAPARPKRGREFPCEGTARCDQNSSVGVLGIWSGIGLVAANMIGAGVFLSAGFMAQDLGPYTLMLAWVLGAMLL